MIYSEQDLNELKELVEQRISPKRFSHVLGVERCAARLASSLIPDSISEVRAAAILHDVSKQLPYAEQIDLLNEAGFELNDEDMLTEGVLHSFTAPIIIKRDFEKFSTDDILSATLKHTVGDEEMSIFDKIIFINIDKILPTSQKFKNSSGVELRQLGGEESLKITFNMDTIL